MKRKRKNEDTKFWGENYYNNPPLTEDMIAQAEAFLGCRLPKAYLDLLRVQNGGYLAEKMAFPLFEGANQVDDCVSIDDLSGIVPLAEGQELNEGAHNILHTPYMLREWGLPEKQVLLSGDGHTWLSLDYRDAEDEPAVIWLDSEAGSEEFLAESFMEFFSKLRPARELED